MPFPLRFLLSETIFLPSRITEGDLRELYARLGVQEIEDKIGYSFKEKSFLLQVDSFYEYWEHSSFKNNFLLISVDA